MFFFFDKLFGVVQLPRLCRHSCAISTFQFFWEGKCGACSTKLQMRIFSEKWREKNGHFIMKVKLIVHLPVEVQALTLRGLSKERLREMNPKPHLLKENLKK